MACKQCELTRIKGTLVTKCGARNSCIPEIVHVQEIVDIEETELLSELNDIDNEEAE